MVHDAVGCWQCWQAQRSVYAYPTGSGVQRSLFIATPGYGLSVWSRGRSAVLPLQRCGRWRRSTLDTGEFGRCFRFANLFWFTDHATPPLKSGQSEILLIYQSHPLLHTFSWSTFLHCLTPVCSELRLSLDLRLLAILSRIVRLRDCTLTSVVLLNFIGLTASW